MTASTAITNLVVITGDQGHRNHGAGRPADKGLDRRAVDFLARTHNGDDIDFEFDQDTVWSLAPVGAPPIEPSNPVVGQFDSIWLGPSQLPSAGVFHRRSVDGGASAAFFGTLPNAILADAFDS